MGVERAVEKNAASAVGSGFCWLMELSIPAKVDASRCPTYQGLIECRLLTLRFLAVVSEAPIRTSVGILQHRGQTAHRLFAAMGLDGHPTVKLKTGCLITALMATTTIDPPFQCGHYRP